MNHTSNRRPGVRVARVGPVSRVGAAALAALVLASRDGARAQGSPSDEALGFECGFEAVETWVPRWIDAVREGRVTVPGAPPVAAHPPVRPPVHTGDAAALASSQIFPFADVNGRLLTSFTDLEAVELMRDGANAVLATYGDEYDFVGFFTNFQPHHTIGSAFYRGVKNDVRGIRASGGYPGELFDLHGVLGIAGTRIAGMLMMWNVNGSWLPGEGPGTHGTRLSINHEFGHRFTCFLPDLLDGRQLQGGGGACGTPSHWNLHVDGQGSAMQIPEWSGDSPPQWIPGLLRVNADTGYYFSFTDLYLMGLVTPAEMDAGNSELRYIEDADCSTRTSGGVYTFFDSSDVIAAAGPRIPDTTGAQRRFRTAWVMIHLPGDPPDASELDKALGILEQQSRDWSRSTLGRSSMDHRLFDDGSAFELYGCGVNPAGSLRALAGTPSIGEPLVLGIHDPTGGLPAGPRAVAFLSTASRPCGTLIPGLGMGSPTAPGELLIGSVLWPAFLGAAWNGATPAEVPVAFAPDASLIGLTFYVQGALFDPTAPRGARFRVSEAARLVVVP